MVFATARMSKFLAMCVLVCDDPRTMNSRHHVTSQSRIGNLWSHLFLRFDSDVFYDRRYTFDLCLCAGLAVAFSLMHYWNDSNMQFYRDLGESLAEYLSLDEAVAEE